MSILLGLLLPPLALLFAWGLLVVAWETWAEMLKAGWHSGGVQTCLVCVVLSFFLLAWPRTTRRKIRRGP